MAWNSQGGGGGPWGSGGGNGGGDGGRGPWGQGPQGPQPPDIEEMLRQGQNRLKKIMPGGFGTGRGIAIVVMLVVLAWAATGLYRVNPGEMGVELLFGKYIKTTTSGLNYWPPAPFGQVYKPNVEKTNVISIGYRGDVRGRSNTVQDVPAESLMITGDQNIVDVDFMVQWRISDAASFLFNIRDPETTIKAAAESAMREVVGQRELVNTLSTGRAEVQTRTAELLQQILNDYKSGVVIAEVKLQRTDPPREVIDAFNDVQSAKQDQERKVNEATAFRNDIVPRARGDAERMIQEATAYREKMIKEAEGEAQRFEDVLAAYQTGKEVTARRLYLERMQLILKNSEKIIIDPSSKGGQGVVPYLALPELRKSKKGGQ